MTTRRLAAALLAMPLLFGLTACSSDEPESTDTSSGPTTTLDLADIPVEEVCAELGVVYALPQGLATAGLEYDQFRSYLESEVPNVIEALRTAAEQTPGPLGETLTGLADRTQEKLDISVAVEDETEWVRLFVTPDPISTAYYEQLNEFSEAQCGFVLTAG